MGTVAFRPTEKALATINSVMKQKNIKNRSHAINYICEQFQSEQQERAALPSTSTEKPFDYEKWYCECEFGTYFKEKKKVHCACGYPSISRWLPKDRLVDPQVCDTCKPRIDQIKEFIQKRDEEKNALAHTSKLKEGKGYFTDETGRRISY